MTLICSRHQVVEEEINGRRQKVFKDRPKTVQKVLDNTVAKYRHKEGFVSGPRRWTFGHFADLANNAAIALQKDYHVAKGDRIGILMGTDLDFAVSFFGVTKIGAVAVPLNTRFKGEELTFEINNSEACILIMDHEFWQVVAPCRDQFKTVNQIFVNGTEIPQGTLPYSKLVEEKEGKIEEVDISEDDTVMIMYTSGTTGYPKGAMQHHRGIVQACMVLEEAFQPDPEKDRMLCAVPMFHSAGIIMSCIGAILMGIPCVYLRAFKTRETLETLAREKVSLMVIVPAMLALIVNHPDLEKYDLSHFRLAAVGAAPKSPELFMLIRKKMPRLKMFDGFGLTETHTMDCLLTDDEIDQNIRSVGKAVPISEMKIVDAEGRECAPNIPGELLIRGSKVMKGYWKNPEATRKAITDGWLHSGDVAQIDEKGYVVILDRIKDMINRGGEKIFSLEVENVLYRHPKILEAAVVGVHHDVFGEEVKACIVLKQGEQATQEEIKAHCEKYLADYKVPKQIEFRFEPLPRNPGGKLMKDGLRKPQASRI